LPTLPSWVRKKRFLVPLGIAVLLMLFALGGALALHFRSPGSAGSITSLGSVTIKTSDTSTRAVHPAKKPRHAKVDEPCWNNFGGDALRSLARPNLNLGRPTKVVWTRGFHDEIEYPPSYCNGYLYVNLEHGRTLALNAQSGHIIWSRKAAGFTASTPAIAGPRLIVSTHGGNVTAYRRLDGRLLWQLETGAAVESSPLVVGGAVYAGAADGKLYALNVRTGRPLWVYNTGGRISSSPSVVGGKVCITTYGGLVTCLRRSNGQRIWAVWVRRDFVRYESFYASPSSDGKRIFTVARSGKVIAFAAASGHTLWTYNLGTLTYGTPAVANGRVFVGNLAGSLSAIRATTGALLWRTSVSGRILAPSLVVGNLVFFSTLQGDTYAARTTDGKIAWHVSMGKFSPGIAAGRHYYFSLNGRLVVYRGRFTKSQG
jgi:outer membrane protein assembly factor BamB